MNKQIMRAIATIIVISIITLACESLGISRPTATESVPPASSTFSPQELFITILVNAEQGGTIALPDGAIVNIPPGALKRDTKITLQTVQDGAPKSLSEDATATIGKVYKIDIDADVLEKAVILEIPFDPKLLPSDVQPDQVFLSTFDEESKMWVYAGGTVDLDRNVINLSVTHASFWKPAAWNWAALSLLIVNTLSLNFVQAFEVGKLIIAGCEQKGLYVHVESPENTIMLQGCIDKDDPNQPLLRLVNPVLIPYQISPISNGGNYLTTQMLSPGGSISFQVNTKDQSPLKVSAAVTQESSEYLAVNLLLAILPGLKNIKALSELTFHGQQVACLLNKFPYQTDIIKLGQAILQKNKAAAADAFVNLIRDKAKMLELIKAARECQFNAASTWSVDGLIQIVKYPTTILIEFEYIVRYFANKTYDEVIFYWTAPTDF